MQKMWVRSLGQEDSLEEEWQPTQIFLMEKFHGQRSLADCSPRSRKGSDTARLCSAHIWREGIVGSTAQLPCCASPSPLSEREEYLKTTRESG